MFDPDTFHKQHIIDPLRCSIGELEDAIDYHTEHSNSAKYGPAADVCKHRALDYAYALEGRGAVCGLGLPITFDKIWHLDIVMTWIPELSLFSLGQAYKLVRTSGPEAGMFTQYGRIVADPTSMNYLVERSCQRIDSFDHGRYFGPRVDDVTTW